MVGTAERLTTRLSLTIQRVNRFRALLPLGGVCAVLFGLLPTTASAQLLELHGIYATGESSHRTVHGVGVMLAGVVNAGPLVWMDAAGLDYVREPALGPGEGSLSASLAVSPNRDMWSCRTPEPRSA